MINGCGDANCRVARQIQGRRQCVKLLRETGVLLKFQADAVEPLRNGQVSRQIVEGLDAWFSENSGLGLGYQAIKERTPCGTRQRKSVFLRIFVRIIQLPQQRLEILLVDLDGLHLDHHLTKGPI